MPGLPRRRTRRSRAARQGRSRVRARELPMGCRARRNGSLPAGADVRVLVVGSYPPPAHGESHRTVATVHRLGAQGDDVHVLSRRGSAAQLRGEIAGPLGALQTWWRGRGYDAIVVQVESGSPLRVSHGWRARIDRAVDCLAWGFALRLLRDVTLVVPDTDVVPRSIGGRTGRFLWTAADKLLVASEHGRRRLVDEGGAAGARGELPT